MVTTLAKFLHSTPSIQVLSVTLKMDIAKVDIIGFILVTVVFIT